MTVATASYDRFGGTAVSSNRFCNVNIVFGSGQVSAVNYTGPTGIAYSRRAVRVRGQSLRQTTIGNITTRSRRQSLSLGRIY
jgi:hypothetical protein